MTDDYERVDPKSASGAPPRVTTSDEHDQPGRLPTHVAASLCYVMSFASGVVFLILETENRSVRFHAFQSILLGAVCSVLIIWAAFLGLIPLLGPPMGIFIKLIVSAVWLVLTVFLVAKAYSGEDYRLPYLGQRAAKLAIPYSEDD
jgi:uncharacterized membrane protein